MERRPATPEEAKALAHPLRLRILRLCLHEARTNAQLAVALGRDPGTVLHHVRLLVASDFLVEDGVRTGPSGALEKPYRSTGKSWRVEVDEAAEGGDVNLAVIDAVRDEVAAAGRVDRSSRMGLLLNRASLAELRRQLDELVERWGERDDRDGEPYGVLVLLHPRGDVPDLDQAPGAPGPGRSKPEEL